ncbi:MAG: hypothetical protein M3120_07205 [Pseudomonadota bacterium]|nr:hypothetical protein [Pseudomonadota bacterium]
MARTRAATGVWATDLDVVAIVAAADAPFERRGLQWDLSNLPVPAELLVFTI